MKKNLSLALVLAVLLVVTYFFQEKRAEKAYVEAQTKGKLLTNDLKSISFGEVDAVLKNGQWWMGTQLLSHNSMKLLEERLRQLTSIKEIKGNESAYFTNSVDFKINGGTWRLGDLSLDKQSFYVAHDGKIDLAMVDGESTTIATNETEMESKKLDEIRALLKKPLSELKETQLFRFYPELPVGLVKIKAEGAPEYELRFKTNETSPAPFPGVEVEPQLQGKFISVLTQMTLKEELRYSPKLKMKKLARMELSNPVEGKRLVWEIWLRSNTAADAVLIDDLNKRAFLMVGGTLKAFFLNVQDYWDKKVIPPSAFRAFRTLPLTLIQGSKQETVTVFDREPMDFEAKTFKVRPGSMRDLLQVIFNLGEFDQAFRISPLSKSERQQYLSEDNLRLTVFEQELVCVRKPEELIVANLTQGFKTHFLIPGEKLRCRFEDVLE